MAEAAVRATPPVEVTDALARVCRLVEPGTSGWTVGDEQAVTNVHELADALYAKWYTQPQSSPRLVREDPPLHRQSLTGALRAAHAAAGRTSDGWTVTAADPRGTIVASIDERSRVLRPGEYRMPLRRGVPPAPGEPVEPVARLDHVDDERGLWWTFTAPPPRPPTGRLYLNARPATAARVVHQLTAAFASQPYQLKCPVFADACQRVDALVVYHEQGAREELVGQLIGRWAKLGPLLDPAVPPLTCRLRPGLAWADDAGDGRSYGESRCEALATGIVGDSTWSSSEPPERLLKLIEGLRAAGIDPARPWKAGS